MGISHKTVRDVDKTPQGLNKAVSDGLSTEELLKQVENTVPAKSEDEAVEELLKIAGKPGHRGVRPLALAQAREVRNFIVALNIRPHEKVTITSDIVYNCYVGWAKAPMSKRKFCRMFNRAFKPTHKHFLNIYYLHPSSFNLPENYRYENDPDIVEVRPWVKPTLGLVFSGVKYHNNNKTYSYRIGKNVLGFADNPYEAAAKRDLALVEGILDGRLRSDKYKFNFIVGQIAWPRRKQLYEQWVSFVQKWCKKHKVKKAIVKKEPGDVHAPAQRKVPGAELPTPSGST